MVPCPIADDGDLARALPEYNADIVRSINYFVVEKNNLPCFHNKVFNIELGIPNRMLVINKGKVLFDGKPTEIFSHHKDELVKVGMDEPQIYKLSAMLRGKGLAIEEGITDVAELVKSIKKAKGWR